MMNWVYGVSIREEGDFVVTVRDLPEVQTSGDTSAQALDVAADAVGVIVAGRIKDEADLPILTRVLKREYAIPLEAALAAKASIYRLRCEADISKAELARRWIEARQKCDES